MKQLKLFIIIFCLTVSIPLAYVSWQTFAGLAQEEKAQLSYFSEAVFDEMETALAELTRNEERRSVEEYQHTLAEDGFKPRLSPLAQKPAQPYILGYFQNNPDGSFQTPLVADLQQVPEDMLSVVDELAKINQVFNQKKFSMPASLPDAEKNQPPSVAGTEAEKERTGVGLADRYIARSSQKASNTYLGKKETRTEEFTERQALNMVGEDQRRPVLQQKAVRSESLPNQQDVTTQGHGSGTWSPAPPGRAEAKDEDERSGDAAAQHFQVEVAPFQSVFITNQQVFIFRRIAINNQIFRQGFVIDVPAFLNHLADFQFKNQPLSDFMSLGMQVMVQGSNNNVLQIGPSLSSPRFSTQRRFPAPFNLFSASLQADAIPPSPARRPLNVALVILGTVMLAGLLAIYLSARTVVDMSERRSQFVSSVTHELKTPLTNIRMYIEMIAQGIAATPEREQEYLQVLDAESARLSRLINNVLELAKLEKKQRSFHYQEGDLTDVFAEVTLIMSQKLSQEGFTLSIHADPVPVFAYDREVLTQLLVNLMENSIKFGKHLPRRELTLSAGPHNDRIRIALSDTGPGIPPQALKKVFDDFYRVDNELTRTTGGTGIGLALVKKFVDAMGGKIQAANNSGPGCTIAIDLPS
ncbi:MAG: HAMP domain-containing histidine kinase [Proteobacteria bacterium]|nr:HAMP domain-containing histidine kinase [Pseudomonadota bacterium]MBU4469683.1 HAMP domain-containing histidine kinase [Pseudomonadota bacterium]MCG2751766.1 HAMP domain-containing histidine kinase [Desulfobacteraceae bacterium]